MTRIAILDLTTHPADRFHGVQRVWERISGWLSPSLPDAALIPFDIAEGGGGLPATGDFDGLIVILFGNIYYADAFNFKEGFLIALL